MEAGQLDCLKNQFVTIFIDAASQQKKKKIHTSPQNGDITV